MLGVCYYPEQWPEAWWADDAAAMRAMGLTWVRIGEFAWSRLEPSRGRFDWGWLDRALDVLGRAGLQVTLGTPTATPPKWLVDERPDILASDVLGRRRGFGSRRHYCFSSRSWAAETTRIVEAVARRYGSHPAVRAWQLDNEYGCHASTLSWSKDAALAFRDWLAGRYGTVARLNDAWGNAFWSMEYGDFREVDPPAAAVTETNPAHRLAWQRFSSDQVRRYNRLQAEIVRSHSPGRPLGHNFMGFVTDFAHAPVAADLDLVTWDSYPLGFTEDRMPWLSTEERRRFARTGHPDIAAFHHDLYRGIASAGRFWVMEQQPGPVNWAPDNPAPAPGMVRQWTLEALAHGAEVVSYFRWRQAPFGQEQFHAGLQRPDRVLDQGGREVAQLAGELPGLHLDRQPTRQARVALVFDEAAHWALTIQPQASRFDYLELVMAFYGTARRLGFDVDVVRPGDPLSGYALVLVPSLPIVEDHAAAALLAAPGRVLLGPRTGSRDAEHRTPDDMPPGPLGARLDARVTRVESLGADTDDWLVWRNNAFPVRRWRERIEGRAAVEARFDDGEPALVRGGNLAYLACWPDPEWLAALVEAEVRAAGLTPIDLPEGLRLRRRGDLTFAFHRHPEPADAPAPEGATWLLGQRRLDRAATAVWRP